MKTIWIESEPDLDQEFMISQLPILQFRGNVFILVDLRMLDLSCVCHMFVDNDITINRTRNETKNVLEDLDSRVNFDAKSHSPSVFLSIRIISYKLVMYIYFINTNNQV